MAVVRKIEVKLRLVLEHCPYEFYCQRFNRSSESVFGPKTTKRDERMILRVLHNKQD